MVMIVVHPSSGALVDIVTEVPNSVFGEFQLSC